MVAAVRVLFGFEMREIGGGFYAGAELGYARER